MSSTRQIELAYAIDINKAILDLGRVYVSPPDAYSQSPENGGDSILLLDQFDQTVPHPKKIWLVMDPANDQLHTIDTGIGMVAEAPKGVEPWKEQRDINELSEAERTYLQSMQRMVQSVAASSKRLIKLKKQKGVKGVGALAVFQLAKEATFVSRPYRGFAPNYFGSGIDANEWLHILYTGLEDELHVKNPVLDYSDDLSLLTDPITGEPMAHGTRVTLTGIFDGVWEKLEPKQLAFFLSKRFASAIIDGSLDIEIVIVHEDSEGKRELEQIPVNPPDWQGEKIFDEVLHLPAPWKNVSFQVQLYYDPEGTEKLPAVLRRKGGDTPIKLLTLPEFSKLEVFRDLGGFVEFPDLEDDESLWLTNKVELADSPIRAAWYKTIVKAIPAIKRAKEEIDRLYDQDEKTQDADELRTATLEALQDLPELAGEPLGTTNPPTEHKGKKKVREEKAPYPYVLVTVMDEYHRSVSNISIELWSNIGGQRLEKLIGQYTTRPSGSVYFGSRPLGWYTMRILVPKGMSVIGESHVTFQVRKDEESGAVIGRSQVFIVKTGKPRVPEIPDLTISFEPFRNHPDIPYIQQLEMGKVRINSVAPEYADAYARGDENKKLMLRALYMASAIAEYKTSKAQMGPEQALWQMNVLFPRILKVLQDKRSKKRKR